MGSWWSLVLAFAAGLAVGVVGSRLLMGGRSRATAAQAPAEVTLAPEPAAQAVAEAPAASEAPVPEVLEASMAAEPAAAEAEADREDPAAAVDDVVAELERRVKGRQADTESGSRRTRRR